MRYVPPVLLAAIVVIASVASRGGAGERVEVVSPSWVQNLPAPSIDDEFHRGVALGLFFDDVGGTYESYLWEAANRGATHVSIVLRLSMQNVRSTEVRAAAGLLSDDSELRAAIRAAHAFGLEVMLFPIVWLDERGSGDWRGRIASDDVDAWFRSYGAHIGDLARLASAESVATFCIGSELGSLEQYEAQWRELAAAVRGVYAGQLIYSSNWDHFHRTPFWDAVDLIGVTGYYELAPREGDIPDVDGLVAAWAPIVRELEEWSDRHERSVVITEVGYVSQPEAARHPWNYTLTGEVDLRAQRDLYEAMMRALDDEQPWLAGVYLWNWFGDGGVDDDGYTPRGKPAEAVIRHWFGGQ